MNQLFLILCLHSQDPDTMAKCHEVILSTLTQLQVYQTLKEKEKLYQGYAEDKLTKPGFWLLTTAIASTTTQRATISGHNVMGIDSVVLKLGRTSSNLSLTWSF